MNDEAVENWMTRMGQQVDALEALLAVCRQQATLIQDGDLTGLMRLLSSKTPQVQRVADNAKSLSRDAGRMGRLDPDRRRRATELKRRCDDLGEQILSREQHCETLLSDSRSTLSNQIESLRRGAQAASTYAAVDQVVANSFVENPAMGDRMVDDHGDAPPPGGGGFDSRSS